MHTFAIQLLFYFQSKEPTSARTDLFLEAVQNLAQEHGITLGDHQSMRLDADDFKIRPCDRCGRLTVNRQDLSEVAMDMLPDFWFHVRRGVVNESTALCEFCEGHPSADDRFVPRI